MIRFDKYQVEKKVGAGGLADVFKAQLLPERGGPADLPDGAPVALKVLRDPSRSANSVARFVREGRLLMELRHPGLPRCYEVLEHPRPFLVLELLDGRSISERMKQDGPLPPERARDVAISCLQTLAWLHARGIVHRDIKAANIFETYDGRVLILDLGMAMEGRARGPTGVLGTFAYMAPEQLAGAAVDHRADLYGMGITLFEMLAGRRPYRTRGAANYLQAHLKAEHAVQLPDGVPRDLRDLCWALMARDPAARPQTAMLALSLLRAGHQAQESGLLGPSLVGRAGPLGALQAVLDHGGALHLVGEEGSGLARMSREIWNRAKASQLEVRGMRVRTGQLGGELSRLDRSGLVVLEDLQRAGAPDLEALRGLQAPRLVTLSTRRVEGLPGRVVRLRDLSLDEVRDVMASMLGTRDVPAGQAERLHSFTGGLPGAVVSTLRDFQARGVLHCEGVDRSGKLAWRITGGLRMERDNSLRRLYRARLDNVSVDERAVLELLAVAREPLPVAVVQTVAELGSDSLALYRLSRDHLIRRGTLAGEPAVGIVRPALAALVATELDATRKRGLNAALANALAEHGAASWVQARLAWFKAHSAPPNEQGEALVRLGERLVRRGSHQLAHEVLLRAVYDTELPPLVSVRAALARSGALLGQARPDEAAAALEAARQLAVAQRARGPGLALAEARLALHRGELRRVLDVLEPVRHSRVSRARQEACLFRGRALLMLARVSDARDEALLALNDASGGSVLARAHALLGTLHLARARLGDARRHLGLALRWLRRVGSSWGVLPLFHLTRAHIRAGQIDEADLCARDAARIADRSGLHVLRAIAGAAAACIRLALGDAEEAHALLRGRPLSAPSDAGVEQRTWWRYVLLETRLALGDPVAALSVCNELEQDLSQVGWGALRGYANGVAAVLRGQPQVFLEAVGMVEGAGDRSLQARLLAAAHDQEPDPRVRDLAIAQCRKAGEALLLLNLLAMRRSAADLREARVLARGLLDGASGQARQRLQGLPGLGWLEGGRGIRGSAAATR